MPTTLTDTDFHRLFATAVAAGVEEGDSLQMLAVWSRTGSGDMRVDAAIHDVLID